MISGPKRSEKEYRKLETLSASDLKTFATKDRREFFKKCILKQKDEDEEESRASKIGSLVHCLKLEPHEFDRRYFMSLCSDPPTGLMEKFVNSLYKHTKANTTEEGEVTLEFKELAQIAYKEAGFKRDNFAKVLLDFKGKDPEMYYREKRDCGDKELLCTEDRNIAERIAETLTNHEYTRNIFGPNSQKETQIEGFNIDGLELKAMIDDIEVFDNGEIQATDLKVTWTNENFFREYFLKRRADIQAFVYQEAVKSKFLGHVFKPFRFVVADSTNFNAPLIYEIDKSWRDKTYYGFEFEGRRYKGIQEIISEIQWHQSSGNWGLSKEGFDNNGVILLK